MYTACAFNAYRRQTTQNDDDDDDDAPVHNNQLDVDVFTVVV